MEALEKKHSDLIAGLGKEIRTLADRVTHLEAREAMLIVEAKAAASTAASVAASAHLSELSRQVGILDERTRKPDGQATHSNMVNDKVPGDNRLLNDPSHRP